MVVVGNQVESDTTGVCPEMDSGELRVLRKVPATTPSSSGIQDKIQGLSLENFDHYES